MATMTLYSIHLSWYIVRAMYSDCVLCVDKKAKDNWILYFVVTWCLLFCTGKRVIF